MFVACAGGSCYSDTSRESPNSTPEIRYVARLIAGAVQHNIEDGQAQEEVYISNLCI